MASLGRVTVTLPSSFLCDIDRWEKNRSKFIAEAVRRELERRRRAEMKKSLRNAHVESAELAAQGFADWARALPDEDAAALIDPAAGTPVRWTQGKGWAETRR
jgi:hypothetical protein